MDEGDIMEKIKILGVPIDRVDMKEAVRRSILALEEKRKMFIMTPNSEIVMAANRDAKLLDVIGKADMTVPDGIGLLIASKIIRTPFLERVAGIDLMDNLLHYADEHHKSVFLLGGKPRVAEKAAEKIAEKYPGLRIAGHHHGYFKGMHTGAEGHPEEQRVLSLINEVKPDMLFVALGAPKQEYFIERYGKQLDARLFMGVGGSLDVYSGSVKRAPQIYQKLGLEWFYRGVKEPWRFKRMSVLPLFLLQVIRKGEKPIK